MLPDADNLPAGFPKKAAHLPVPALVPGKLLRPETSIRSRNTSVDRAPMPKAAVYKDRQSLLSEHEVGATWQTLPAAPTGDRVLAEDLDQPQFRRAVSRGADT